MALYTIPTNFKNLVTPPVLKNNTSSCTSATVISASSPATVNTTNTFPGIYPVGSVITNAVLYGTGLSGTLGLTVFGATSLGAPPVGTLLTATGTDNFLGANTIPMPLAADTWLYVQGNVATLVCSTNLSVNYV